MTRHLMRPHPLDPLSLEETQRARDIVRGLNDGKVISFRHIYLEEPPKRLLVQYLEAEHAHKSLISLDRNALVQYDVIGSGGTPSYHESIVNVESGKEIWHTTVSGDHHINLTMSEFARFVEVCEASKLYNDTLAEFSLPDGFEAVIEPWPYGGTIPGDESKRFFQGLVFARDARNKNPDSNFYPYPLPFIPVMDVAKQKIVRIERLATGGKGEALDAGEYKNAIVDHCVASEYVPELLPEGVRTDMTTLNVLQPDGPSFSIKGQVVEWQGWRFRVGFNAREGATLHDVRFQGRSVFHRISMSEMTVPYADPRYTFPRKQAFDFGDGGAGSCANNLSLGCDCLGVIKYFDSVEVDPVGNVKPAPNVVCLHEQDNGIGWKHTNWRTGRAVVTRLRELVVQFIITLANYEYIFAYKLDQAGGITIETRATGVVSVVSIDAGKTSDYGNVVSPGALAQNHQHIFCVRMDPAIDGHKNSVVIEESLRVPTDPETNPYGNFYKVDQTVVDRPRWIDAAPELNRIIKVVNPNKLNSVSGNPVGYKFTPASTQVLLANPGTVQSERARFAHHHVWLTKHVDRELFAAGRYTLQSKEETGGVADAIKRNEPLDNEDVVIWNSFGLTHNPRCEDWPVMPVEIFQLHLKPSDFFVKNPAINVPSNKNAASTLTNGAPVMDCCRL